MLEVDGAVYWGGLFAASHTHFFHFTERVRASSSAVQAPGHAGSSPGLRASWVWDDILMDTWALLGLLIGGIFFALKILYSLTIFLFVKIGIVIGQRNAHRVCTHHLSSFIWDCDFLFKSSTGGQFILVCSVLAVLVIIFLILGSLRGLLWILPEDEY